MTVVTTQPPDDRGAAGATLPDALARRPGRPPDYEAECRALYRLAEALTSGASDVLRVLVEQVIEACGADSAGVGLIEAGEAGGVIRWLAMAGAVDAATPTPIPADAAVSLASMAPGTVLLNEGTRYIPPLRADQPPVHESLLAMLPLDGVVAGLVWAARQHADRPFDAEDARLLVRLGDVAWSGWWRAAAPEGASRERQQTDRPVEQRMQALREREARQAFLVELGDALRPLDDPAEIETVTCRMLEAHLESHPDLHAGASPAAGTVTVRLVAPTSLPSSTGQPFAITDIAASPHVTESARDGYRALGIRAMVSVPVTREGKLVRTLGVIASVPRQWTNDEILLLRGIAERMEVALERARVETALRESEERYRLIVEEATDYAIFTADANGRIETWTPGAEAVFGWSADAIVGRSFALTFTPEDREAGAPERELETARDTGAAPDIRWHRRRDGRRVFIEGTSYSIRDAAGAFRGIFKIGQDITERRRAEQALQASEERYRTLFESIDQAFCTIEVLFADDGRPVDYVFREINPAFARNTGLVDPVGKHVRELALELEDRWLETYGRIARTGVSERFEAEAAALGRWYNVYAYRIGEPSQHLVAVLFEDITERREAEVALLASEAEFRAVANLVPDLLWQSAPDGSTGWYNDRWYDYTGQTPAEAAGWGWVDAIHPDDRARSAANYARAAETGTSLQQELRIRAADGSYRWFLMRAEPMRGADGTITRWFGTATDVHEARVARDELASRVDAATAELRALSRRLLSVQEEERRYLARELHDEIGQILTGLGLQLGSEGPVERTRLVEARRIVRELTDQVRQLSMELRPAALDRYGLLPSLLWHIERYHARTGVTVDLRHEGIDRRFPSNVEITVYRIVQEALTNVARHAGTAEASVRVLAAADALIVVVRDEGVGFDPATTRASSGFGGMRERVELLGGSLSIESAPGSGTVISAELALDGETDRTLEEA